MDKRQVKEVNHFKRITMSLTDIRYADILIQEIKSSNPQGIMRQAAEESLIISYSRPFSDNDSGKLRSNFIKEFTEAQKNVHERVSNSLRNKVVAHSDSRAYGVTFSIFETGEVKWGLPRQRKLSELLSDSDVDILALNCKVIESWLFIEQSRVKEFLPCGQY